MFKKLLIIGCGLIGSSLLRASINKKISRQILVFEKSKKYKKQIKSINAKIIILDRLDKNISDVDFVILSTPMSEYKKIIPKLNKYIKSDCIITDVGSTKLNVLKILDVLQLMCIQQILPLLHNIMNDQIYGVLVLYLLKN